MNANEIEDFMAILEKCENYANQAYNDLIVDKVKALEVLKRGIVVAI